MFVSTEIPEQAARAERAFGIDFCPGSELQSAAEEKIPEGYVCGGVFTLQLEDGAEPKMRTRGVISPLGELIGGVAKLCGFRAGLRYSICRRI